MPSRNEYDEFEIEVRSLEEHRYEARVVRSPVRCMTDPDPREPAFSQTEVHEILRGLHEKILVDAGRLRDLSWVETPATAAPPVDPEALGRALFDSLFSGQIGELLRASDARLRAKAKTSQERGLLIRLTFDRRDSSSQLAAYPWEFLLDRAQHMALHRRVCIARSFTNREVTPTVRSTQLRVLLVNSQPTELRELDTRQEMKRIQEAVLQNPQISADLLEPASLGALRKRLRSGEYHVLHFMGHGGFRYRAEDKLVLWFEGDQGESIPVSGSGFAEVVKDAPGLRLIVLNACMGAAFPRQNGQDPFSNAAVELMKRDIPAVIAMQQPISDGAAIAFSDAFYERLAAGESAAAALTEARLAVFSRQEGNVEWATPILFLSGGADLFEMVRSRGKKGPDSTKVTPKDSSRVGASETPTYLEVRSFNPPGFQRYQDSDAELDLTGFFEPGSGRFIKRPDLWRREVFPRLEEFLLKHASTRRPLVLDFAAHSTIAYAAGYCLDMKSGLDLTVLQRGRQGTYLMQRDRSRAEAGPASEQPLWLVGEDQLEAPGAEDLAVALNVAWNITADVRRYVESGGLEVSRLIPMTVAPEAGPAAVEDAAHALQLAQTAARRIRERNPWAREGTLHLFAAAPNVLLFFLGQFHRVFGRVQLYEYDPTHSRHASYEPSLILPLP